MKFEPFQKYDHADPSLNVCREDGKYYCAKCGLALVDKTGGLCDGCKKTNEWVRSTQHDEQGCGIQGCENPPYLVVRTGVFEPRFTSSTHTYCKSHMNELWERMKPLVTTNKGHWTNWPPGQTHSR